MYYDRSTNFPMAVPRPLPRQLVGALKSFLRHKTSFLVPKNVPTHTTQRRMPRRVLDHDPTSFSLRRLWLCSLFSFQWLVLFFLVVAYLLAVGWFLLVSKERELLIWVTSLSPPSMASCVSSLLTCHIIRRPKNDRPSPQRLVVR